MKSLFIYIVLFCAFLTVYSQEVAGLPERTPEQEAVSQTERLQRELNLTSEQTQEVYEINLHYARKRQQSNSRSEALERVKNKNADLRKVLNDDQYHRLQTKHYDRSSYDNPAPQTASEPLIHINSEPDLSTGNRDRVMENQPVRDIYSTPTTSEVKEVRGTNSRASNSPASSMPKTTLNPRSPKSGENMGVSQGSQNRATHQIQQPNRNVQNPSTFYNNNNSNNNNSNANVRHAQPRQQNSYRSSPAPSSNTRSRSSSSGNSRSSGSSGSNQQSTGNNRSTK